MAIQLFRGYASKIIEFKKYPRNKRSESCNRMLLIQKKKKMALKIYIFSKRKSAIAVSVCVCVFICGVINITGLTHRSPAKKEEEEEKKGVSYKHVVQIM